MFIHVNRKVGAASICDHLIGNGQEEKEEEASGSPKYCQLGMPFEVAFA
jgi:hypothetical protein